MSFPRGAALPTATTFGHAGSSNLGPTDGNGFDTRWQDDLSLLSSLGLTDVRLTFDWPRLQPRPGRLDQDWAERFDELVDAANATGLRIWATLHDGAEPKWVDDDGGLDDDETITRWWPRWVEHVADRFGDRVHGWVPFAEIPDQLPLQPWADTWGILRGGDGPVVASVHSPDAVETLLGFADRFGVALSIDDDDVSSANIERFDQQLLESIHAVAEAAADLPIVITRIPVEHDDVDANAVLVEHVVHTIDRVIGDGVPVGVAFADPAIALSESASGLVAADRAPRPAAEAYCS